MKSFLTKDRKPYLYVSFGILFVLLLQFNNCNSISSQKLDSGSNSFSSSSLLAGGENTPVNATNPYVLRCIKSSDGVVVSAKLTSSVISVTGVVSGKINSLDWVQDEDLIVTLDNGCVAQSNYSDTMMEFVSPALIKQDMPFTVYVIKKESVKNLKSFIDKALASECLISAEKNQKLKLHSDASDPKFTEQKHLAAIGATEIFLNSLMTYNSGQLYKTKVAVIDSGVDVYNPDLIDQMAKDTNGFVLGYNSTGLTADYSDLAYHGTHVTGLIAAGYHNGISGSGVWGRNIEVYPIRAFQFDEAGELTAKSADVANAIIWATTRNVELINLSLGSETESLAIKNAISFAISKNVTIVVAAGNDSAELSAAAPQYPAMHSIQFNGLITVGSLDATSNKLSSFSNYSSSYVDILAPGSNSTFGILSTVPVSLTANGSGFASKSESGGVTSLIQGTSMSTPIVTGALAAVISLAKSRGVKFTNSELETFLTGEGSPKNAGYSTYSFRGNYLNLPTLINYIKTKIDAAVVVPPSAFSIIEQPANKQVVVTEAISISVDVASDTPPTYQWYFNNGKLAGATNKVLTFNQIKETQGGSYYVEITSGTKKLVSRKADVKVALRYCN